MLIRHRLLATKKELINNPINWADEYTGTLNYMNTWVISTYPVESTLSVTVDMYTTGGSYSGSNVRTITSGQTQSAKLQNKAEQHIGGISNITPQSDGTYIYVQGHRYG
jgi:hypothetical protein